MKTPEKEFVKLFNTFHGRNNYDVFRDFVTCASSALIVRANPNEAERSEAEYMETVKRYKPEELEAFCKMLAITALALEQEPQDFLGSVFMQCDLGNDRMGQFFTPYELSYTIAELNIHGIDADKSLITVQEPACGSGGMVVAFAEAARKRGVDVGKQVYVVATDLSEVAARMAYIQLSFRGIPAHVCWGNTISLEVFRTWATMAYWPIAHKVAKWRQGWGETPEPAPAPVIVAPQEPARLVQATLFD